MKRGDSSAYPCKYSINGGIGLTKRELFAAMAMQGILGNSDPDICGWSNQEVARFAADQADALLDALENLK
ncbi:hypothetical protein CCR98_07640 [Stenotrophomonas sp. WZN-1]|uniref:hypothetical protein n=1 Tax=Stenotrophomonas sp. WZN-1 TaxID=2005046 RepID=UPI000B44C74B|nr:hypothetical protein [Stenotrophomonas sp. WZN-1]ARZ74047.1 hypothetical protein CCR98_07640 [Stenotrophomonas sp. WZN-1]